MSVERITSGLNLKAGDRFIIFYGTSTSDTFCTEDLILGDIEQMLHRYLLQAGYERILFYSGVKKLYFLDSQSRDRTRLQPVQQPQQKGSLVVSPGPMGSRRLLSNQQPKPCPKATEKDLPNSPRLQDVQILPIFEKVIQDTSQKSALVFSQAEDLREFDNRRELFGRIVDWSRLLPNNPNLCILIFHHENRKELENFCNHIGFTFLANLTANRNITGTSAFNFVHLKAPERSEIRHLTEYFRLHHHRRLDWKNRDKLMVWLSAENRTLDYWYANFKEASEISLVEAQKHHWLSGTVSTQPALERLEEMIGLAQVKKTIRQRIQVLEVNKARQATGQTTTEPPRLHLVFKGNPGTGKTTVARLIGEIYRDLGLLERGHVIEVAGRDLVAGYVGHTAIKTNELIDKSLDGILFIDEAYTLVQGGQNDFGTEAIDTLLKRMEDERHHLAVIVAGYPANMDEFIKANPGLQRRFNTEIIFEDYNPTELMAIFQQRANRIQCHLTKELKESLQALFTALYEGRDRTFGNAGMVENLFQAMDEGRATRVIEQNLDPLKEPFQVKDIPEVYQPLLKNNSTTSNNLKELLQELDNLICLQQFATK